MFIIVYDLILTSGQSCLTYITSKPYLTSMIFETKSVVVCGKHRVFPKVMVQTCPILLPDTPELKVLVVNYVIPIL